MEKGGAGGKKEASDSSKDKLSLIVAVAILLVLIIAVLIYFLFFSSGNFFFQRGPYSNVDLHKLPLEEAKVNILEANRKISYYDFESETNMNMSISSSLGGLFGGLMNSSQKAQLDSFKIGMKLTLEGYNDLENKKMEARGILGVYNLSEGKVQKINESSYVIEIFGGKMYVIIGDQRNEVNVSGDVFNGQDNLRNNLIFINESVIEFLEDDGRYYVLKISPNAKAFTAASPTLPGQEGAPRSAPAEGTEELLNNISFSLKVWVNKNTLLTEKSQMFYDMDILFFRLQMGTSSEISNARYSNNSFYTDDYLTIEFPSSTSYRTSCTPKTCSNLGYECGNRSDGCGGRIYCGNCPSGERCSVGRCVSECTNECSSYGSKTCVTTNSYKRCGYYDSDSCLDWGSSTSCSSGQTCSSGDCITSVTLCTPNTCSSLGYECGIHSNGCGTTINCGSCISGKTCSSGQCVFNCTPKTCSQLGKNCETWDNGCGTSINCGSCLSGQTCTNGTCIASCVPKTCTNYTGQCGSAMDDGCSGTIDCSTNCLTNETCSSGTCVPSCTPKTCADYPGECGSAMDDGCSGTIDCSTNCGAGETCDSGSCVTLPSLSPWMPVIDFFKKYF